MTQQLCYDILLVMNKDLQEYAQKAFKIGQINGKAFVIKNYLENAFDCIEFGDELNAKGYIKDALKDVEAISKLTKQI